MVSLEQLHKLKALNFLECNPSLVKDIAEYSIPTSLPPAKRLDHLIFREINPYLFRVNDVTVKVEFTGKKTLADAIAHLMTG